MIKKMLYTLGYHDLLYGYNDYTLIPRSQLESAENGTMQPIGVWCSGVIEQTDSYVDLCILTTDFQPVGQYRLSKTDFRTALTTGGDRPLIVVSDDSYEALVEMAGSFTVETCQRLSGYYP